MVVLETLEQGTGWKMSLAEPGLSLHHGHSFSQACWAQSVTQGQAGLLVLGLWALTPGRLGWDPGAERCGGVITESWWNSEVLGQPCTGS